MKAIFLREVVGFKPNTHVLYTPTFFEDKDFATGKIYWEGKNAFKDLKKYCIEKGYFDVKIDAGKKIKRYFFKRTH